MSEAVFAGGDLRLLRADSIARLTLARPEALNSLTFAMWTALPGILEDLAADGSVRVLVIAGSGTRAFSAGADIGELPEIFANRETTQRYNAAVRAAQASLAALPVPTIAEIRGSCFGGGCGLTLHCDLRFADRTARFAITPARLGLAYSFEDTARLVSVVGPARAKDMLFSGRALSCDEALSFGLIDRVVSPPDLGRAVADYVESLTAVSQASIRVTKATVNSIAAGDREAGADLRAAFEATFSGPDAVEGYAAFMEKRKPNFS